MAGRRLAEVKQSPGGSAANLTCFFFCRTSFFIKKKKKDCSFILSLFSAHLYHLALRCFSLAVRLY